MNLRDGRIRFIILIVIVAGIFIAYAATLYKMQIIDGASYKEQSQKKIKFFVPGTGIMAIEDITAGKKKDMVMLTWRWR